MSARTLQIRLLGEFELSAGDCRVDRLQTRKATGLFAALALQSGHMISRESLAETFWSDCAAVNARKSLRTDLWRIKRILADMGVEQDDFLICTRHEIGFNPDSRFELDVATFQSHMTPLLKRSASSLSAADVAVLEQCIALYRGDLLQNDLSDWCALQRQELRSQYIYALELLMGHHEAQGRYDSAVSCGYRLIQLDPLLEHIHFALMRCHARKSDRATAIRHYHDLKRLLREELGISPADEIHDYYASLLRCERVSGTGVAAPQDRRTDVGEALKNINRAASILTSLHKLL